MYNEILRIASQDLSSNPWAIYVPNNFSVEQIKAFKFILNSFPENLLIDDGELNSDVISVLAMMAYDIGESRSFIKNIKISKDFSELYNSVETNRLLSSEPLEADARIGDAYIYNDGSKEVLKRYVGFTWDEGTTFTKSDEAPITPTDGDYWYNTSESKLYIYDTSEWVEVREVYFKPPKKPNYDDTWINFTDNKIYKYLKTYWEEVPLYKNNMKLLLGLLQDMNFTILDEVETIEDKEEIAKNYELLAKDSYKIIRNRGTVKTIERIVSAFIRSENNNTLVDFSVVVGDGSHAFLEEPSDSSPLEVGTILIDIPNLEDYSRLSYLLDTNLGTDLGATTYTLSLKKDNYLYKSLMKVKPAGINYLLVSSGNTNTSHSVVLTAPELEFISASYGDERYKVKVVNPNNYSTTLHLVDYNITDPGVYTYSFNMSPYQIVTISRPADNEDFSVSGNVTTIKAYLESKDGTVADSSAETVEHVADSQLVNTSIVTTSKSLTDTAGYLNALYRNYNDIAVTMFVTLDWAKDYWYPEESSPTTIEHTQVDSGFINVTRYGIYNLLDPEDVSVSLDDNLRIDIAYLRNGDAVVLELLDYEPTNWHETLVIETGMEYDVEQVCNRLANSATRYYNDSLEANLMAPAIIRFQHDDNSYVYYKLMNSTDANRYKYYTATNTTENKTYNLTRAGGSLYTSYKNPSDRVQDVELSVQAVDPSGERDSSEIYTETIVDIAKSLYE